jgi:hypothetical protein
MVTEKRTSRRTDPNIVTFLSFFVNRAQPASNGPIALSSFQVQPLFPLPKDIDDDHDDVDNPFNILFIL